MPAIRLTLSYDETKAKILKKEAKRQKRPFSNYLQRLFVEHIEKKKVTKKVTSVKKQKRVRRRKK